MKRILIFLISCFFIFSVHAAEIVNVEYIHNAIRQNWDITVPYNTELLNPQIAANMKYLLTSVDVANEILNGGKITSYGTDETYATENAADTIATDEAIKTLITKVSYPFEMMTTADTTEFGFSIAASGTFYVDWGDGNVEKIKKADTTKIKYSHTYAVSGEYNIKLGGTATGYSSTAYTEVVSFRENNNLAKIFGSLGQVFPTIENNVLPRFMYSFYGCKNLTGEIPAELFSGVVGVPRVHMFYGCSKLVGEIPDGLFSGIKGPPAEGVFSQTFTGCSGLTGEIPSGLFSGIKGKPAPNMFASTFSGCSGLTGEIPGELFSGISGAPASGMFNGTFHGCSGLSGTIPKNLFSGIKGKPASNMFSDTFSGCSGLTGGLSPELFAGISGAPATSMYSGLFFQCKNLTGGIPNSFFGSFNGAPANNMFQNTFTGCTGLTGEIPENLFIGISGNPAAYMFENTFSGCRNLTGKVSAGLFSGISGVPANYMFSGTFNSSGITAISENIFAGISGTATTGMFQKTFYNCAKLTGPSAKTNGRYLYEIWPDATESQVGQMYFLDAGLSDYAEIPAAWK